jgi:hypothetical protein
MASEASSVRLSIRARRFSGRPARRGIGRDFGLDGVQDRTGVHARFHLHDRDAGGLVTAQDGPLDRRGAAPAGQDRGVHVEHAEPRDGEDRRWEDVTVGHHDPVVGANRPQLIGELARRALRLQHGDALVDGDRLDRRRDEPAARATLRAVGLGHHRAHVEAFLDERAERRHRELRGSEEGDAHQLDFASAVWGGRT